MNQKQNQYQYQQQGQTQNQYQNRYQNQQNQGLNGDDAAKIRSRQQLRNEKTLNIQSPEATAK